MTHETHQSDPAVGDRMRPFLRVGIAGLLLGPGASKFLTYGTSVRFFASLGLPSPGVLVPLVGAIELGAAALLLLDAVPRTAALLVVPVMVVAAATAGPTFQNLGVLAAAVLLIALDTPEVHRFG